MTPADATAAAREGGPVLGATAAAASGAPHVTVPVAYDGILLVGFGGPEGPDDVLPFLRNVTRGRNIPEERLELVATQYRHFGGVSPINAHQRRLKAAIEAELADRGVDLAVYWGNRNWAPYLRDAVQEAADRGARRLIALTTSAYSSYSSCRQYRENLAGALADTELLGTVQIDKVRQYFDHPGFVTPFVNGVRRAIDELERQGFDDTEMRVIFTTHSIPETDAARSGPAELGLGPGGAYVAQHQAVAEIIMGFVECDAPWSMAYQSRSGSPAQPWLEPDINAVIAGFDPEQVRAVVIVPLGFVSDHMEVLWDLDVQATRTATERGLAVVRVSTPGVDPEFVSGLVDLVMERVEGRPVDERAAVTPLGPWYDVCRAGCCENVRAGFKPAVAGVEP